MNSDINQKEDLILDKNSQISPENLYLSKFNNFSPQIRMNVKNDTFPEINFTEIETMRFTLISIFTDKTNYKDYPDDIKQLYDDAFSDPKCFCTRTPYLITNYEEKINTISNKTKYSYPFTGFIVKLKENGSLVGFTSLEDTNEKGSTEGIMIIARQYHRNQNWKYVGYEIAGAMNLFYAKFLSDELNARVNCNFDENSKQFIDGEKFYRIILASQFDNIPSQKLNKKMGFNEYKLALKDGAKRYYFERIFGNEANL
jgi:hypothetical protein